jgi:hypothetical protein
VAIAIRRSTVMVSATSGFVARVVVATIVSFYSTMVFFFYARKEAKNSNIGYVTWVSWVLMLGVVIPIALFEVGPFVFIAVMVILGLATYIFAKTAGPYYSRKEKDE